MVAHNQFPYSFLLLLLCFSDLAPCYCLLFCLFLSILKQTMDTLCRDAPAGQPALGMTFPHLQMGILAVGLSIKRDQRGAVLYKVRAFFFSVLQTVTPGRDLSHTQSTTALVLLWNASTAQSCVPSQRRLPTHPARTAGMTHLAERLPPGERRRCELTPGRQMAADGPRAPPGGGRPSGPGASSRCARRGAGSAGRRHAAYWA